MSMSDTNSTTTAHERLRTAAEEVATALRQLDIVYTECGACRAKHFRNIIEGRLYEQLQDLPDKLRRAADKIATQKSAPGVNAGTPTRS